MTIAETGVFYALVSAAALLLCWRSEKTEKRWGLAASVLLLSLVAGLRAYSVGVDTMLYKNGVEYFYLHNEVSWQNSFAYGYGIFSKAVLSIWNNYSFLLFVQSLLTNGLILARFWDYRKEGSITFMLLVYLCTTYLMTLCIMVQHIAVAITFYFSRYLDRGKPVLYCVGVALAGCLHVSALVAIFPLATYLVKFKDVSLGRAFIQVIALTVLLGASLVVANQLFVNYSGYNSAARQSSIGYMVFAQALIFAVILFVCGYGSQRDSNSAFDLKGRLDRGAPHATLLYVLSLLLSASSYVIDNAGRISYYFSIYGAPCYGIVVKHANKSKGVFLCSFIAALWFIAFAIYTFYLHDGLGIFPYSFIWN